MIINNMQSGTSQVPVLKDSVCVTWKKEGEPGKLEFEVVKNEGLDFQNGSPCRFYVDGELFFYGFCFTKTRNKDPYIKCIAYDQTRYLKFKDTIQYKNKSYSELLKMILKDRNLEAGDIDETEYSIPHRTEREREFSEMLAYASEQTTVHTGEVYILFDKAGKICLKNIEDMKVEGLINCTRLEDWDYSNSINEGTYNRIKVQVLDEDEEVIDEEVIEDSGNIAKWGVLQYYAMSNEPREVIRRKAKGLLQVLNREAKTLKLKNVLGNVSIRGGSLVPVALNLGDTLLASWMIVESVTHTFKDEKHVMDMEVRNSEFSPAMDVGNPFKIKKKQQSSNGVIPFAGGAFVPLPGNTNEERIWNCLRRLGYSPAATAGIMSNLWRESGYDPTIKQLGGGPGRGIAQWSVGERWQTFLNWAAKNGKDPNDVVTQTEFIHEELTNGSLSPWINRHGGLEKFMKTDDVEWAVAWFYDVSERGLNRGSDIAKSTPKAKEIYSKWANYGYSGSGIFTWPTPTTKRTTQGFMGAPGFTYASGNHRGIDIGGNVNDIIVAADSGIVEHAGFGEDITYGNSILINHGNGLYTRYAHLSSVGVRSGQPVSKGEFLGYMGNTGNSQGVHLHFEVLEGGKWGKLHNPLNYVSPN